MKYTFTILTILFLPIFGFTHLKIYNGTPSGVPLEIQGQKSPINDLSTAPPLGACPISNLHQCKEIKPKLCINCKYFITDNDTGKYGRCMLFKIEGEKCYTLVNGNIMENKNEYQYCVVTRQVWFASKNV